MPKEYATQTMVRLSVTFQDLTDALIDPTNVALILSPPDAADVTITSVIRDSLGKYHYDWIGTSFGNYIVRWQGTGAVVAASTPYTIQLV